MKNDNPVVSSVDCSDEIDLFELFQTLWQQKWLIVSISLIAPIIAYVFTAVVPYKADYYQGSAVIEVATIQDQSEKMNHSTSIYPIQVIEPTVDLVQLVSKLSSVSASIPKGSTKLLEISVSGSTPEQVTSQLEEALKVVEQRHSEMLSKLKHIEVVSITRQVGDYAISLKSPKDKLNLILAVAFVLGGMLGVFIALIRSAIHKRRQSNLVSS